VSFRDAQEAKAMTSDLNRPALEISFGNTNRSLRIPGSAYIDVSLKNVGHSTALLDRLDFKTFQAQVAPGCLIKAESRTLKVNDEIPPSVTIRKVISTTAYEECSLPTVVLPIEVDVRYEAIATHRAYRQRYSGVAYPNN
jgi:hypothetical protein